VMKDELVSPQRLRTARALCTVAACVYPLFFEASRWGGTPYRDPLCLRWWVTGAIAVTLVGSFVSATIRRRIAGCLLVLVWLITLHMGVLLVANELPPLLVVMLFVVLTGFIATASFSVTTTRQLLAYLALVMAETLVAVALVDEPRVNPAVLLLGVGTVLVLTYVAVRVQLDTFRRLVRSQAELCHDIRRRESTELALRDSEGRANALLDTVPDVMLSLDGSGVVLAVLNHHDSDLGRRLEAFVGRSLDDCADGSSTRITQAVARALQQRSLVTVTCSCHALGSEQSREIEVRIAPAAENEAVGVVRDITQEKAIEAKLRVTDRLAALGTLASGVAHEINNPLSYVSANLGFAQEQLEAAGAGLPDSVRSEATSALAEAREGSRRIRDIVAGLRERSSAGDDVIGSVDANEAVQTALRMLDNEVRHRARVEVELGPIPYVVASPLRLLEIMLNLVTNALQALPDRPSDENRLRVRTRRGDPGRVAIEVSDNGVGMRPELLSRIFDPFFTTKEPGVGTGLGLYLCHRFVFAFGGDISATSAEGQGTTFYISLRESAQEPRVRTVPPGVRPEVRSILVVDDEPLVLRSLTRMLCSYDVVPASSAREALDLCGQRQFDVILCDMMMPGMDGVDFHQAVEGVRAGSAASIVFMTGGAFTDRAQRFLATVPNPWIEKPLTRERLLQVIQEQTADT